ncbi:MAG TPA: STAS domain-containing protein [Bacteroidia bacterium]|jgi:anti-sigma B factor antagonist
MVFGHKTSEVNGIPVFHLMGELIDRSQAKDLIAEVDKCIEGSKCKFVFELEKLKYVNSSGLGILIMLLTRARKNGGEIVICCVNQKVKELLVITKLNTVFTVTKSVESAVAKLK